MNVGIVAEGPTDQRVLEALLVGGLAGAGITPVVNDIQPVSDATGGAGYGGWELVFAWLGRGDYRRALQMNDLVVIQLDTDVCERVGFEVSRREGGRELTDLELVDRVIERVRREIDAGFLASHGDRLVFAIAVNELECWLLPLVYDNQKAGKTLGCFEALTEALKKKNEPGLLRASDATKDPRRYRDVARPYRKGKLLDGARAHSPSLDAFLVDLHAKAAAIRTGSR